VTTADKKGQPNAAAMGIIFGKDGRLTIKPYFSSDTFRNIKSTGIFAVNFTQDPALFTLATLFQNELTSSSFVISKKEKIPVLRKCAGTYLMVKVLTEKIDQDKDRGIFICEIIYEEKARVYG
jgi:hypothetical protein